MRVINGILGVLAIVAGFFLLFNPFGLAYSFVIAAALFAVGLLVYGIFSIINFFKLRKLAKGNKLAMGVGVAGLILGIFALVIFTMALANPEAEIIPRLMVFLFAVSVIVEAIYLIISSVVWKPSLWGLRLALGIILLLVACSASGIVWGTVIAMIFAIELLITGVVLLVAAFTPDPEF